MTRIIFIAIIAFFGAAPGITAAVDTPKVVISIAPLHSIAVHIMKGAGEPVLLVDQTLSPHDFALKPSQARLLQSADLVFWLGQTMETPLIRPIKTMVSGGRAVALLEAEEFSGKNPHVWLDPVGAATLGRLMATELAQLDSKNADLYRRNSISFDNKAAALTTRMEMVLVEAKHRVFLPVHDAFGDFARRFGLQARTPVMTNHVLEPGAAAIIAIRKRITTEDITCLVSEYGEENHLAEILLEGKTMKLVDLDPLGAKLSPGAGLYEKLMENLAIQLAECLN